MDINSIAISGRIVSEIELRKTSTKGYSVMNLRLSHNNSRNRNTPVYVDVEVWGKTAEEVAEKAKRNSFVIVYGELRRDVWEQETNGNMEKRSKLKITADKVIIDNSQTNRTKSKSPNSI